MLNNKKSLLFFLMLPALCFYALSAKCFFIEKYNTKIGCVDVKSVCDSSTLAQLIMSNLQMEVQSRYAILYKEEEEITTTEREFRDKEVVLSKKEKERKEKAIADRKAIFKGKIASAQQEFAVKQNQVNEYILKTIRAAITDIAKEEDFRLIFEKQNILYGSDIIDLTEKVIKRLDKAENKK